MQLSYMSIVNSEKNKMENYIKFLQKKSKSKLKQKVKICPT